ncbi:ECF RNA polymerase sigma factor SigW [Pirellulimonas nuda]|uniref:ECF RNA polymerase sigma factor SigW n=1 Tax=Pirellulimonas nuda TaxID=2528009 RepID=A0A518D9U6_9BACT|nr:RNA polymerase sigma factor [Pirellulimonas nuda]QDU88213.1 ECF RNA polymerase sigma factor SigW [Pirellulimonas nuda]
MALSKGEFRVLVEQHAPALYALAYRLVGDAHEAEDIVQETLRSAWCSRERFDQERGERAWLASILRRRVVDRWRRSHRVPTPAGDQTLEVAAAAVDPLALEYTDEMQHALAGLSPELRESLLLVVVGELTHHETADLLGVPLGTVLSRVSRARQKLRKRLLADRQTRSAAAGSS